MTWLSFIGDALFWTGCVGALFAAYLALVSLLTDETVIDKGRWGETEQADHRSHSRTYVADRTHERGQ